MLVETIACQSWLVFLRHSVNYCSQSELVVVWFVSL